MRIELGAPIPGPDGGDWPILHGHRMRIWFARITDGTPEPLADHDELRWLPLADPFDVAWLEPDLPVVHSVCAATTRSPGFSD